MRERPTSLIIIITTFIFVIALLGSAGVFMYKYVISQNIDSAGKYLSDRKEALEPATINDLVRTDRRLRSANALLSGHILATPVFNLLEELTLKTVRFNKFEYIADNVKGASLKLSGEAKSYGSVALQADLLNGEKRFIKNAVFSNLNLDDKGNVTFDAIISFDQDLISYKKALSRDIGVPASPSQ